MSLLVQGSVFGGQAKDLVGSRFGFDKKNTFKNLPILTLLISKVRDLAFRSKLDVW